MDLLVLTVSDRVHRGVYSDRSGPAVEKVLSEKIEGIRVEREVVPDERELILKAFEDNRGRDVIITTGGTGLGERDITPDVTAEFCERLIPGIAEYMRAESAGQTRYAALSRAVAGTAGNLLIINFPGSEKGAAFCAEAISELLEHALAMMRGEGH